MYISKTKNRKHHSYPCQTDKQTIHLAHNKLKVQRARQINSAQKFDFIGYICIPYLFTLIQEVTESKPTSSL